MNVWLNIPAAFHARAEYTFGVCAQSWGLSLTLDRGFSLPPDLIYGDPPPSSPSDVVVIPFDAAVYDPAVACTVARGDDLVAWLPVAQPDPQHYDVIGSIFRLLTLLDESQVAADARNDLGVFPTTALSPARRETAQTALVDLQAGALLNRIVRTRPDLERQRLPHWRDGKSYALCLTHDTDATWLSAPSELAYNAVKTLVRRDPRLWQQLRDGLRGTIDHSFNPFFGFPLWGEFERAYQMKSSFYLFPGVMHVKRHLHDVRSTVFNSPTDWRALRALADEGWEFGLHPAINAKTNIDEFLAGKARVEAALERPIFGVRHHYLALNWAKPYLTFRQHVNAGFRYDSSIAWDEVPGFRAGTSLPYQPFDLTYQRALALYELPTVLLDGHIIPYAQRDNASIIDLGCRVLDHVKQLGGVAVVDWHTQTASNQYFYTDYLDILRSILTAFVQDQSVWLATAWEIVQHWHQRAQQLRVTYV